MAPLQTPTPSSAMPKDLPNPNCPAPSQLLSNIVLILTIFNVLLALANDYMRRMISKIWQVTKEQEMAMLDRHFHGLLDSDEMDKVGGCAESDDVLRVGVE